MQGDKGPSGPAGPPVSVYILYDFMYKRRLAKNV